MTVFHERVIEKYCRRHADARQWLENWLAVARASTWRTIHDVRQAFPAADGGVKVYSGGTVTVFDVGGNKHRLIVAIVYASEGVFVLEIMTHAEYSKGLWKMRY